MLLCSGKICLDVPAMCGCDCGNHAKDAFFQVKKFVAGEMVWIEGEPVEKVVLVAKGILSFTGTGMHRLSYHMR